MKKKKVVLGQVGLGNWGPNLLRNFMTSGQCEVRLVCDLKRSNYRRLGLPDDRPAFTTDYRDILDDPDIDAVIVATPSETHYALGREVLRSGKHLFVEKPFALTSREASRLVELSRKSQRLIMVGHLLMYHPGIQTVARMVRKGKVGKVFFIGIRRYIIVQILFAFDGPPNRMADDLRSELCKCTPLVSDDSLGFIDRFKFPCRQFINNNMRI